MGEERASAGTEMSDDYLWDRSGTPDEEILQLERLLERLRVMPAEPAWPAPSRATGRPRAPLAYLATAAALVLACAAGLFALRSTAGPAWLVATIAGNPVVAASPVLDAGRLAVGEWLETDARSRATIDVADIGRLEVEPSSRVRLVATRSGHHQLALSMGTVHALIWAPPGQFVIDTPSSRAIDLGCAYTLHVDPVTGAGLIEVTAGWVALEYQWRESFIPAGAQCATRRGAGPGTPRYTDAPERLATALDALDLGVPDPGKRRQALDRILASARSRDAFSVWHLLARVSGEDRDRLFDGLSRLVPPPPGVTRELVRKGDRVALDAWWDALDLGTSDWWRTWQREWKDSGVAR